MTDLCTFPYTTSEKYLTCTLYPVAYDGVWYAYVAAQTLAIVLNLVLLIVYARHVHFLCQNSLNMGCCTQFARAVTARRVFVVRPFILLSVLTVISIDPFGWWGIIPYFTLECLRLVLATLLCDLLFFFVRSWRLQYVHLTATTATGRESSQANVSSTQGHAEDGEKSVQAILAGEEHFLLCANSIFTMVTIVCVNIMDVLVFADQSNAYGFGYPAELVKRFYLSIVPEILGYVLVLSLLIGVILMDVSPCLPRF